MYAIFTQNEQGEWIAVGGKYDLPRLFHTQTAASKEGFKGKVPFFTAKVKVSYA